MMHKAIFRLPEGLKIHRPP